MIKYDTIDGTVREKQLFNLKANPNEFVAEHQKKGKMETNLAGNPKYSAKLKEMEDLLRSQMVYYHDPYTLWNQGK